jgi:hypothetical protein
MTSGPGGCRGTAVRSDRLMGSVESSFATGSGDIRCASGAERQVWRVGYVPEPWSWTPWQFAEDGRFNGRWDDPNGVWRSLYGHVRTWAEHDAVIDAA